MSQLSNRFQITTFSGMGGSAFSPVIAPFEGVRKVVIRNPSGGGTITISTEDSPIQTDTLAAGADYTIDLNSMYPNGGPEPWHTGEAVVQIKGSGSQPTILFYGGQVR